MKAVLVAAGVSISLHAAGILLVLRPAPPAPPPREKPVHVEVMRLAGLISPRRAAEPAPPEPVEGRKKRAQPAVRPSAAPAVEAVAEEGAGEREAPAPPQSSEGTGEESAPSAAEAPLDTTALSRRLQQVALRCYPAAARRFRQTGQAQIRFCLDGAGALRESTVSGSSGSELLDQAASTCVIPGAAPFGPETFGRCFTLPVRFQ